MCDAHAYLSPDYLPSFHCKMGSCRRACCEGWPISFSMTDYFRLIGVDCSPELRRRIDCSMHLRPHPTQDAYAQIVPRWDGSCPLHLEDGRCALQAELGEEALSAVCRLYPRGVRTDEWGSECSCAASCEAVTEMLYRSGPLRFTEQQLKVEPPPCALRMHVFETGGREREIRLWLIGRMQDRRYPLPRRLMLLGCALHAVDDALQRRDFDRVDALLSGREAVNPPDMPAPDHAQLMQGLRAAERLLDVMDQHSRSVHDYGEAVLTYFSREENVFGLYEEACAHFAQLLPLWESWMENLLVNHMFFARFPFQDRPVSLRDEFTALCGVYALLRCLCVGWMADREDPADAMDVASALFRLVEHTEFDRYAAQVLRDAQCSEWNELCGLESL